jgi:hypothetical protein
MSISHVNGHRTGRPKGSKSTPAWVRALNWAERNLGNPGAVPPTVLAAKMLQLAQDRPELFVRCLALRDAPQREAQVLRETYRAANGSPMARGLSIRDGSRIEPWDRLPGGLLWLEVDHSHLRGCLESGLCARRGATLCCRHERTDALPE